MTAFAIPELAELMSATREWVADIAEMRCGDRSIAELVLFEFDRQVVATIATLSGAVDELEFYGGTQ